MDGNANATNLPDALDKARKAYSIAQDELERLKRIEYLAYIQRTGTVEGFHKSMADVFALAEDGYLSERGGRWTLTPKAIDELSKWEY